LIARNCHRPLAARHSFAGTASCLVGAGHAPTTGLVGGKEQPDRVSPARALFSTVGNRLRNGFIWRPTERAGAHRAPPYHAGVNTRRRRRRSQLFVRTRTIGKSAVLRPRVFALARGDVNVGFCAQPRASGAQSGLWSNQSICWEADAAGYSSGRCARNANDDTFRRRASAPRPRSWARAAASPAKSCTAGAAAPRALDDREAGRPRRKKDLEVGRLAPALPRPSAFLRAGDDLAHDFGRSSGQRVGIESMIDRTVQRFSVEPHHASRHGPARDRKLLPALARFRGGQLPSNLRASTATKRARRAANAPLASTDKIFPGDVVRRLSRGHRVLGGRGRLAFFFFFFDGRSQLHRGLGVSIGGSGIENLVGAFAVDCAGLWAAAQEKSRPAAPNRAVVGQIRSASAGPFAARLAASISSG